MPKEFINPNYHVILIHYPLGVFVMGVVLELGSFLWKRSSLRTAARWMIMIGALSSIPASLSGIYAIADVARRSMETETTIGKSTWEVTVKRAKISDAQWKMLRDHTLLQSIGSGLAVATVVIGMGVSDRWRNRLYFPLLGCLVITLGLFIWGAWNGGETVYRQGTAVRLEAQPGEEAKSPGEAGGIAAKEQTEQHHGLAYFMEPLQTHVIMAGVAIAFAMGAIGASMRKLSTFHAADESDEAMERDLAQLQRGESPYAAVANAGGARRVTDDISVARTLRPDAEITETPKLVPASRFWLLAALLTFATAAGGILMLGVEERGNVAYKPDAIWSYILNNSDKFQWTRGVAHVFAGTSIVLLTLILAGIARWAPRQRMLLAIFSTLLLAAVALQVWFGVLLTTDSHGGPLFHFKHKVESNTALLVKPTSHSLD